METTAKIQLSPTEMELVSNKDWILSKHNITKKVFEIFGGLNELMKKEAEPCHGLFPGSLNGKISKGENYQLLPYVILDYPALFGKEQVFAVRTMFWWGNFFSVTLHLSGRQKENYTSSDEEVLSFLQKNNFHICVNEDEWEHHFETTNYVPAAAITLGEYRKIIEKNFFKVSKNIPLSEWEHLNDFVLNTFREIIKLLQISYPAGKKDPSPGSPKAGSGL